MFNNVGLDIFIGLVFIFLLYSLLASIVAEMLATTIALRARNLREAVDRMLNDERENKKWFFVRLWDTLKLTKKPTNPRIINFYNHPEIKYLGSTGIFKVPSQFKAVSFSKTILYLLNEIGYKKIIEGNTLMNDPNEGDIKEIRVTDINRERIKTAIEGIINDHEKNRKIINDDKNKDVAKKKEAKKDKDMIVLDEETAKYVLSIWHESHGDLVKFRLHLETWFDRTMEQCLEWYKRKIQVVLLLIGFFMAWIFNADTFRIVQQLSDDNARGKLMTLVSAYSQNRPSNSADTQGLTPNLISDHNKLKSDIDKVNNILGHGSWPPNKVIVSIDPKTNEKLYTPAIDPSGLSGEDSKISEGEINFKPDIIFGREINKRKWRYFFNLLNNHFWGYLITALAISLGAPFWFDLLNKIMRLRTAVKQPLDTTKGDDNVSIVSL